MVTADQLKLIRATWDNVHPHVDHGVNIFCNLFKKYPDNFKYFPKFQGTSIDDLKHLPAVHVHAISVMGMFAKTINILDMEGGAAEVERIWTEIGHTHKVRKLPKQAFMEIREVMLDYLVSALKLNEAQKAAYVALVDLAYQHFLKMDLVKRSLPDSTVTVTAEQLQLIRDTWVHVTPQVDHGVNIFYNFFKKHPSYLDHFPKFHGTDIEHLKDLPAVHVHALSVIGMFDKTINILGMEGGVEEAKRIWIEIGTTHKTRNLPEQPFKDIRQVILDYLTETLKLNDDQQAAYTALVDFAYHYFLGTLFNTP